MKTVMIAAICFFGGAALLAPPAQVFKVGPAMSGPYALKGGRMWSVGPVADLEPFTIPAQPPAAPVVIMTGISGGGSLEKQVADGTWERIATTASNQMFGMRPGLRLSTGSYRLSAGGLMAFGYYAPAAPGGYAGSDVFPDQTRLWQCQPILDGTFEFTVPTDKAYVVNYVYRPLEKWDGASWVQLISTLGYETAASPGIKLASGLYRVGSGVATSACSSGYIVEEN